MYLADTKIMKRPMGAKPNCIGSTAPFLPTDKSVVTTPKITKRTPDRSGVRQNCRFSAFFDFKRDSFAHREERDGWVVLKYYPFVSREMKKGVNIEYSAV